MSDISKLLFNINKWWVRFEEQVFDWLDLRIGSGSFLITLVPPDNKKKQTFPFFLELKWWSCTEPVLLKGQGRKQSLFLFTHSFNTQACHSLRSYSRFFSDNSGRETSHLPQLEDSLITTVSLWMSGCTAGRLDCFFLLLLPVIYLPVTVTAPLV